MMGRRAWQPLWERLHRWSLTGMNVGPGGDLRDSGELWVLDHVAARVRGRAVVFDVGANQGEYADAALARFPAGVDLFCFEPSKSTFDLLSGRVAGRDGVRLFNFGFGAKAESVTLYSNQAGSGLASVYARRLGHFGIEMKPVETIRLRTMDDFCREEGIAHIHLAKLDVEGHELSVLRGAQSLIQRRAIDFIQWEFGGTNIDSRTYFQDFFYELNEGYRIHRVLRRGLAPIDRYYEALENFMATNFLAISRSLDG